MKKILTLALNLILVVQGFSQLTIASPINRSIVQRNTNNNATITISGFSADKTDKIEYKLNALNGGQSTEWNTLTQDINNAYFTKDIIVQAGWYELQLRAIKNNVTVANATLNKFGVGEVFIIAGQSNAEGYNHYGQPSAQDDRVNTIANHYSKSQTAIPYPEFAHIDSETKIGLTGNGAWFWGLLGDKLAAKYNVPILFLNTAWEGSDIASYKKSALGGSGVNYYSGIVAPKGFPFNSLRNTINYYTNNYGLRSILFIQGETDTDMGTSKADYLDALKTIILESRKENSNSIPWVVSKTSYTQGKTSTNVRAAQDQIRTVLPNIYEGPDNDLVLDRLDGVHYAVTAFNTVAESWMQKLNSSFFSSAAPISNVLPVRVSAECNNNLISLKSEEGNIKWNTNEFNETITTGPATINGQKEDNLGNVKFTPFIQITNAINESKVSYQIDGNRDFCAGTSVKITTDEESDFKWSTGSSSNTIEITESESIFITNKNNYGCTVSSSPITFTKHLNPTPVIEASNKLEICKNEDLFLTVNTGNSILWNTGQTENKIKINDTNEYFVTETSNYGCTGKSNILKATVKPIPEKPILNLDGDLAICSNESLIINVENPENLVWSNGETKNEISVNSAGEFYATNTNNENCSNVSEKLTTTIKEIPDQPIIKIEGDLIFCSGNSVNFINDSDLPTFWSTGETTKKITVSSQEIISLKVQGENNCFSNPSDEIQTKMVISPDAPSISKTGSFQITADNLDDYPNKEYIWVLDDTEEIISDTSILKLTNSTIVKLKVNNFYQLEDRILKCPSPLSSSFNYIFETVFNGFSIYPNPNIGEDLTLATSEDLSNVTIILSTLGGKVIKQDFFSNFAEPETITYKNLQPGKYIITLKNEEYKISKLYLKL